ncbi:AraC family transcriptional regulator [Pseudonocardiaceae bacterium YIM PH 21723]|nr:AraC family transcriptional regulator [Pseudonocardiaceae bacterium YIM PH 21723]
MQALVFDSDDLERTEEFLSDSYAPMRIGSSTRNPHAHISRIAGGGVSIDRLDLAFEMDYDVFPLRKICIGDLESGTLENHRVSGWASAESFGTGTVFSVAPPDRPYTGTVCEARYSITMLEPHLLQDVVGETAEPVRLLDHHPVTPAAAHRLRQAIGHVRDQVLGDPEVVENPLLLGAAARYLAACVLDAFPHTGLIEPTAADRRDAGAATLRRALGFIEEHLAEDLTAARIAGAAHVTVRTLQYAFRRHLDCTPMAYLRQRRLERAHRALREADPQRGGTVMAIARAWGFRHQGHFADAYRRAYHHSPGETLRG